MKGNQYGENMIVESNSLLEEKIIKSSLSKAQFAEKIGISRQYLYKILNGESKLTTDQLIKSSEILNTEISDLFDNKCDICHNRLSMIYADMDRLGNNTFARKTEKHVKKIYDCQKCGYIQITEKFAEYINIFKDEFFIIGEVIHKVRINQNLKWYETITPSVLKKKDENTLFLLKSKSTSTMLTFSYKETEPSYSYKTAVIRDDISSKPDKTLQLFLHTTPKSKEIVAKAVYQGETIGTKKNNSIRLQKGTKIPINDNLSKSVNRKRKALNSLDYNENDKHYILTKDGNVSSPSLAAAMILGKECSGTRLWKDSHGYDLFTIINSNKRRGQENKGVVNKSDLTKNTVHNRIDEIKKILSTKHNRYLNSSKIPFDFTNNKNADKLVKDIENYPEAFFIGCIMDRGIKAEKAWKIPYKLKEILGSIKMNDLNKLSFREILQIFDQNSLHRYKKIMSEVLFKAIKKLIKDFDGDPSNIWSNTTDSNIVVKRFKEFYGVGNKISTMAVNILYRDFKIKFDDLRGIDISPDSQVLKVFKRIGLIEDQENTYEVIQKAREMNPKFPGIFDVTTWEIGRKYCHTQNPNCDDCPLKNYCEKNI